MSSSSQCNDKKGRRSRKSNNNNNNNNESNIKVVRSNNDERKTTTSNTKNSRQQVPRRAKPPPLNEAHPTNRSLQPYKQETNRRIIYPVSRSYRTFYNCWKTLNCSVCGHIFAGNRNLPIYLYQCDIYCSWKCIETVYQKIVHCEYCTNPLEFFKACFSFATGQGTLKCFCDKECLENYKNEVMMCGICSAAVPPKYYDIFGPARFCSYNCMSLCSMTMPPPGSKCLHCRVPLTKPVLNVLQHQVPTVKEWFCSFACKLEFEYPYYSVNSNQLLFSYIQDDPGEPLFCAVCCTPVQDDNGARYKPMHTLGKKYAVCQSGDCDKVFKAFFRTRKKCAWCGLEKYHFDMIEKTHTLHSIQGKPSYWLCSGYCVATYERPVDVSYNDWPPNARLYPDQDVIRKDVCFRAGCEKRCAPGATKWNRFCSEDCEVEYQLELQFREKRWKARAGIELPHSLRSAWNQDHRSFGTQTDIRKHVLPALDLDDDSMRMPVPSKENPHYQSRVITIPAKNRQFFRPVFFPLPVIFTIPSPSFWRPMLICPFTFDLLRKVLWLMQRPREQWPENIALRENQFAIEATSKATDDTVDQQEMMEEDQNEPDAHVDQTLPVSSNDNQAEQ